MNTQVSPGSITPTPPESPDWYTSVQRESLAETLFRETPPVFSTVTVYSTVTPASVRTAVSAVLVTASPGGALTETVVESVTGPTDTLPGAVASTDAVLTMLPASRSAWVTRYWQVYVRVAPGSRSPESVETRVHNGSVAVTADSVVFPEFVTSTEYPTVSPTSATDATSALLTTVIELVCVT